MAFDYIAVGKRIQHYRLMANKTQEELADSAGMSLNGLSNIERGKTAGKLDKYYNIAQALGITVDMLIDGTANRISEEDALFSNRLFTLAFSLSLGQRKMLLDFIELLNNYTINEQDQ